MFSAFNKILLIHKIKNSTDSLGLCIIVVLLSCYKDFVGFFILALRLAFFNHGF